MRERAAAGTADHVDDRRREQHRDDDAAAVAVEEQRIDDARRERARDADEHRLEDGHRVAARKRQTREGADDQADEAQRDDVEDHVPGSPYGVRYVHLWCTQVPRGPNAAAVRYALPSAGTKRFTNASDLSATSRHPLSIVREWPRFGICSISVTLSLRFCLL